MSLPVSLSLIVMFAVPSLAAVNAKPVAEATGVSNTPALDSFTDTVYLGVPEAVVAAKSIADTFTPSEV